MHLFRCSCVTGFSFYNRFNSEKKNLTSRIWLKNSPILCFFFPLSFWTAFFNDHKCSFKNEIKREEIKSLENTGKGFMTVLETPDLWDVSHLDRHSSSTYHEALLPATRTVYFMTLLTAKETNCENVTGAKLGLLKALKIWSRTPRLDSLWTVAYSCMS